jgi:hypothetical protein
VPTISTLTPASITAGSAAFTLTVNGTNFISGASVSFNGALRATTYVSGTQLTAAILASDVASASTASVIVTNPAPGGGASNTASFSITTPSAASYTLSSNTAAQAIFPGSSAQYTITATAANGTYSNPIALSVSGLPSGASATFAPASITPGNTSASSTLTIQTAQSVAAVRRAPGIAILASVFPLFGLLFAAKKKRVQWVTLAVLTLVCSLGATGCNGGISYFGDHPQTYNITVTGTSGAKQQSTTIKLTVNF